MAGKGESVEAPMMRLRGRRARSVVVKASFAGAAGRRPYQRYDKPPYSYTALIAEAILRAPDRRRTLAQILADIQVMFPFFQGTYEGWKDSVRHTLSNSKKLFEKELREPGRPQAKGNFWKVLPAAITTELFQRQNTKVGNGHAFAATLQEELGRDPIPAQTSTAPEQPIPRPLPPVPTESAHCRPEPAHTAPPRGRSPTPPTSPQACSACYSCMSVTSPGMDHFEQDVPLDLSFSSTSPNYNPLFLLVDVALATSPSWGLADRAEGRLAVLGN